MSKEINRIIIPAEALENDQMVRFPSLLNGCEVYGLRANNKEVILSVDIIENAQLNSTQVQKKDQTNNRIKWVYGLVRTLNTSDITWYKWFSDTNKNRQKDEEEDFINNKPLQEDSWGVNGSYNIADTCTIRFEQETEFEIDFFWVEPFLVHPELHLSEKPKGIFIVPLDSSRSNIYKTRISSKDLNVYTALPREKEIAEQNKNVLYYDEKVVFSVYTLLMPAHAEINVEIIEEKTETERSGFFGSNSEEVTKQTTLYKGTAHIKQAEDSDGLSISDEQLLSYLKPYLGKIDIPIFLTVDKKPEDQKQEQNRTFNVTISHSYLAFAAQGKSHDEIYPTLQGYVTICYGDMNTLLERRNIEVDQFVEKQDKPKKEPGNNPCHYTKIDIQKYKEVSVKGDLSKKDGAIINIFNEKELTGELSQIDMIAGDDSPAYFQVCATDLDTKWQCRQDKHTKGGKSVFYFPDITANEYITELKTEYNFINLKAPYHYIRDNKLLNFTTFPFNYFWLTEKDVQKRLLMVETCRYATPVQINVYPDIKWTFLFKFNFEESDFKDFTVEKSYELKMFHAEINNINFNSGTHTRNQAIGLQITRNTTKKPKVKQGGFKQLLEIVKRIQVSLTAEYADKTGKIVKHDVIEERVKEYYEFLKKIIDIVKLVYEFCEGEANTEDRKNKSQLDKEINKMTNGVTLGGAFEKLMKKPTDMEILYPSLAISATWFFQRIEDKKQPAIDGKIGLQLNFKLKADPVVGVKFTWDILELLCRRHPIAFLIKKALDLSLYLMHPDNGVNVTFTVIGQLKLEANLNHNLKTGNAYTRGYSAQKEKLASGDTSISANLQGEIIYKRDIYIIIAEAEGGFEGKVGVKTKIGNKSYLGADNDGIYLSRQTYCDGLTFYVEGKLNSKLKIFGFTIFDWSPEGKAEWTCGKFELDWIKFYFNNAEKQVQFVDTTPTK